MKTPSSRLGRGALAGVLAASAIAIWFLIVDLAQGQAFRTPSFLARVLLGMDGADLSVIGIAVYTVLHFAAFIGVGIVTAWVAERLEVVPGTLLGIVLGFLLFDLVFYGSVLFTGVDVVRVLGWPVVLLGNVIAGMVLFAALTAMGGVTPLDWRSTLAAHQTIREGLVTGLIGAGLVALWFLGVDLIAGRPFFTPAALGSAILTGAGGVGSVQVTPLTVLGYTFIHFVAFLITGLVAAAFFAAAEDASEALLLGGVLLFGVFEVFSIGLLAIVSRWLIDALSWWSIVAANLIAAVGMGVYLAYKHPRLMHNLRHHDLEEELAHDGDGEVVGARGKV
jgi:hypothetical protein